jgi:hypothetical protein
MEATRLKAVLKPLSTQKAIRHRTKIDVATFATPNPDLTSCNQPTRLFEPKNRFFLGKNISWVGKNRSKSDEIRAKRLRLRSIRMIFGFR